MLALKRLSLRDLGLLLAGFTLGAVAPSARAGDETYELLTVFAQALHHVEASYVRKIAVKDLVHGAIRGVVAELDPHSAFLDPEQVAKMDREAARIEGDIGILVGPPGATVLGVFPGSSAERVGIGPKDRLVSIAGGPVDEHPELALLGPAGTLVELEIENTRGRRRVMVVRERSPRAGVAWKRLDRNIVYVSIGRFADGTEGKVRGALEAAQKTGGIAGLVLDLRGNPGGLLSEAVRIADLWLASGTIVSIEGRERGQVVETAFPKGTQPPYPVAILVDERTASAAEALAAALSENRRATLVGTRTFGKGTVQTVIELADRSLLRLTTARYFPPSGQSLDGRGIEPHIQRKGAEAQLSAALEVVSGLHQ
ncbi:MAG: S41 family peptidase [Deltaproteobacteria bacterium]|nr:S41 family peptidase [Deltaproteobacteria bacterium]